MHFQHMGFKSVVIKNPENSTIAVSDFKIAEETYLSLFVLDASYKEKGFGSKIYGQLENIFKSKGSTKVRIDNDTRTGQLLRLPCSGIILIIKLLVMEQSDSGKCHCHTVFVTSCDYILISYRSARLCNIFHTALMSPLNVIAEREERI